MRGILLDTCAVIWIRLGQRMKPSSLELIADNAVDNQVFVSPFTAWELSLLSSRGRLNLGMDAESWLTDLLRRDGMALSPLPVSVLVAAHQLPGTPPHDPADRILIATARQFGHAIVTRDRRILDYGDAGLVQTITC